MGLAASGESIVLNALLAARFVSLHTTDPALTGTGEVVGGAYARQAVTFTNSGANPTIAANSTVVQFPTATAGWGTVGWFGLWTTSSGGNFLAGWPVKTPKSVGVDDIARWDVGKLQIATDELIP
jgi:hypothetical protein